VITAHIPLGYILSRAAGWQGAVVGAAIIGAAWPDLDLIWFYLIDDRTFHRHHYWVHVPAFVLPASMALLALTRAAPRALVFRGGWAQVFVPRLRRTK
jgi:inner membrane protein